MPEATPAATPEATPTPAAPPIEATPTPAPASPEAAPKAPDDAKLAADILNRDWTADLPDDLKETGKRFTSKADAVRAINDFRKRESQVRVPGKNASPEEIAAYHKAIGIPEKPEEYEFPDMPEGLELSEQVKESRAEWGKRFQKLGIPKEAAKELSKLANEDALQELVAQKKADEDFVASQEAALRSEWKGEEYDRNKTLANRAFTELANRTGLKLEDLTQIETKDGRFLMDRAEIVRMFAAIGREMSEGSVGPSLTDSEKDTVDDQIRGVRQQVAEAQSVGDSKRANKLYQQEQALIAKREGSKAIVGARGRMV
jgi:DNA repair exonuclease SbcCD nuclease subunit